MQPHVCVYFFIYDSYQYNRPQETNGPGGDPRPQMLAFRVQPGCTWGRSYFLGKWASEQHTDLSDCFDKFCLGFKKKQQKKKLFLFCGRRQGLITACDVWERQSEELYRGCEAWESNVKLQIASGWYWLKHFQILGPNWEHFFWDPKLEHLYEGQEESLRLWCHLCFFFFYCCCVSGRRHVTLTLSFSCIYTNYCQLSTLKFLHILLFWSVTQEKEPT